MSNIKQVKNKHYQGIVHLIPLILLGTFALISVIFIASSQSSTNLWDISSQVIAKATQGGKGSGGGGKAKDTCTTNLERPCYDKQTGQNINPLNTKNGTNAFRACTGNAASNEVGDFIQKTAVCDQEIVTYCHDGSSDTFIRYFTGNCSTEPPPDPEPSPPPSPEPSPTGSSGIPFRITSPDGGESWAFGSSHPITWEGGITEGSWPVFLSIINHERTQTLRELVVGVDNDGSEPWIVDLPVGNYIMYGQGCRFCEDSSTTEWDYSDFPFSVVEGSFLAKIITNNIVNQSLVVLSPSGGESWANGSFHDLIWSGGTNNWSLRISLISMLENTTYSNLYSGSFNDGIENWQVPAFVPPGPYKLFIGCENCGAGVPGTTDGFYAYSFGPFDILLP